MNKLSVAALTIGFVAAACLGTNAKADTYTYDYSGASMSGTQYGPVGPDMDYESLPYCCMNLEGSITLASPLAPNLVDAVVIPDAMTFNLTVQAPSHLGDPIPGGALDTPFDDLYEPAQYVGTGVTAPQEDLLLTESPIQFSTDSSGDIIGWSLNLFNPFGGAGRTTALITDTGDSEVVPALTPHQTTYSVSNSVAGTWTEQTNVAPELDASSTATALTFLAGLITLLAGWRRPINRGLAA